MLVVVPLRGFADAKSRLDPIPPARRAALARAVADHVITTVRAAGVEVAVVTGSDEVAAWCADRRVARVADPGGGLNAAAATGVAAAGSGAWGVLHGDLPLLTGHDVAAAVAAGSAGSTVLTPSRDGGTNLIVGTGTFPFRYGPGSFARHLAAAADRAPLVLVTVGLAVEIDTPADLTAAAAHPAGAWIRPFLS